MNKLIICTTGTSIANQCPVQKEMFKQHNEWNSNAEELKKQIIECLPKSVNDLKKRETRKAICAELNTLESIGVNNGDRIVLLTSDNAQGRVCSEMIKKVIIDAYGLNEAQVEVRRIEGLQVHNAKTLREQGLKNLVKVALEYLANEEIIYSYNVIINPIGGFKGIVPFLTILGMLYGKQTVYMFEYADELITLPPLPFSFDLQLYSRVRPALSFIDKNVAVTEQAFLSKVTNYSKSERELFMAFTEPFGENLITLSPLAYCLLNIEEKEDKPMVSSAAMRDLNNIKGVSAIVLKRLVTNSSNPLWRGSHIEHWSTTDLLVIKQPRTAERIAGFIKDGRFYVTHAFSDHNEYERTLVKFSKKDFDKAEFIPWTENKDVGVDEANQDALAEERDLLLLEKGDLKENLINANEKLMESENLVVQLKNDLAQYSSQEDEKNRLISEKNEEIKKMTNQIKSNNDKISNLEWRVQLIDRLKASQSSGMFSHLKRLFGWKK
jgi:putative CRISPR-associated protein (TIGR02619 family)